MSKCPVCKNISCGDDLHTKTKYNGPEIRLGDSMKVILREIYDILERDNLQVYEIKALILALIDTHIDEVDLNE